MKSVSKETTNSIWVLVYTKAKEEKKANENLQNQGFKTFLPLIAATNKNGAIDSPIPLFPRYLFAQINLNSNWTSIKSTHGVSNIVMFSEQFTPIPEHTIESIKNKLTKEGIYYKDITTVDYKKGDSVSIKEGSFAGLDAIFLAKKSKDRVRLLLKFLNTSVVAEMTSTDLKAKEVVMEFKL
jgi:transcriptional antiterminator RfaH